MKLSVTAKQVLGFTVLIVLIIISGVFSIISFSGNQTNAVMTKDESLPFALKGNAMQLSIVQIQEHFVDAALTGDTEQMVEIEKLKKEFEENTESFLDMFKEENEADLIVLAEHIEEDFNEFYKTGKRLVDVYSNEGIEAGKAVMEEFDTDTDALNGDVDSLVKSQVKELEKSMQNIVDSGRMSIMFSIIILAVSIILGVLFSIIISRSISVPLNNISDTLKNSSSQIALSSNQLASSAQEISNGATEQASSIEETTSSMEELASMVKQNAGNSKEAASLSEKAQTASQGGYEHMELMLDSMTEINKSSEEIRNVIEVIDNIAFQTNILALNAAVEAARAGEAGMGFAVVADEVKNLANRSAEAAKETAAMIENSIKRTEGGLEIARKLSEIFKEILTYSQKVAEMSKEVETASVQQDTGINQVNKALVQLDQVVQTNASSAEETASSAEELTSQAGILNDMVSDLILLVTGKKEEKRHIVRQQTGVTIAQQRKTTQQKLIHGTQGMKTRKKEIPPDKLIPFEEDDEFMEID